MIDQTQRLLLLQEAFRQARSIGVQCYLLGALVEEETKQAEGGSVSLMDATGLGELKAIWIDKIQAVGDGLLSNSQLPRLLRAWRQWGDGDATRDWCIQVT